MRRFYTLFAISAALAFSTALFSCTEGEANVHGLQGSVAGEVNLEDVDDASGVEVVAEDQRQSTVTDEDGEYRLDHLSLGEVEISADHPQFDAETRTANVEIDEVATLDFDLELSDAEAELIGIGGVPESMLPDQSTELELDVDNPDHVDLDLTWEATNGFEVEESGFQEATLTAPSHFGVEGQISVEAEDPRGMIDVANAEVATRGNEAPVVTGMTAQPPQAVPGGTIDLEVDATDPDGDDLEFHWSAPSDWSLSASSGPQVTVTAPDAYDEIARIELEVVDQFGATTTAERLVSTITNQGPQLTFIGAQPPLVDRGETIDLEATAVHPVDAPLEYDWWVSESWTLVENEHDPTQPHIVAPEEPSDAATVELTVTDPEGREAFGSLVVSTYENNPPLIESLQAEESTLLPGESTSISAEASDPDGQDLTRQWDVSGDWTISGDAEGDEITVDAPDNYSSSTTVEFEVSDGYDTVSDSISLTTVDNAPPVITEFSADPYVVERNGQSELTVEAEDPYGDDLSYDWNEGAIAGGWSLDAGQTQATLDAPNSPNEDVEVTITVSDDLGETAESSLVVSTAPNTPPTIEDFEVDGQLEPNGSVTVTAVVDAQPDDDISYDWMITGEGYWSLQGQFSDPENEVEVHAPDIEDAPATLTLEVSDQWGDSHTATLDLST